MAKFRCKVLNDISNNIVGLHGKPCWMVADEIYAELERWLPDSREEDLFKVFCHFCSVIELDLFEKFIKAGMKFDERICKKSSRALKGFAGIVYLYIMAGLIDQVPVHMVVQEVMLVVVSWPRGPELKVMIKFLEESGWMLNTFIQGKIFYLGANSYRYNVYFDYAIKNKFEVTDAIFYHCGNVYALRHFHRAGYNVVTDDNYRYNVRENNIASAAFLKRTIEEKNDEACKMDARKSINEVHEGINEAKKEMLKKDNADVIRMIKYEQRKKYKEEMQRNMTLAKSNVYAAFNK